MHKRDTFDVLTGIMAILGDALAIFCGLMLAVWVRFDSGWFAVPPEGLPPRDLYFFGSLVATLLFLFIFGALGLYKRPQLGTFGDKIPRFIRAILWGILLATVMAFIIRTDPPYSRLATGIAFFTVLALLIIERFILFKLEIYLARRQQATNRILVLGTGENAAQLKEALENEPRLRSEIVGYLRLNEDEPSPQIPTDRIRGTANDLPALLENGQVDQVILSNLSLPHPRMAEIILQCERALVTFYLVPDLFRILTTTVDIQTINGVPLLGIGKWPLDHFWNRMLKRTEDVAGATVGLILTSPLILLCAILVKRSSPGPAFFRQERCGESGEQFTIFKLRTMPVDAEEATGPVFATKNDQRPTRVGAFMRRHNLDELPQFWNVLKGEMSLVGPRPERPHFVEQFKGELSKYMWRHVSKPGITGWAQVNGLRGDTSIEERVKYDLYYLENWSLAFDFKILVKTFFARDNAY